MGIRLRHLQRRSLPECLATEMFLGGSTVCRIWRIADIVDDSPYYGLWLHYGRPVLRPDLVINGCAGILSHTFPEFGQATQHMTGISPRASEAPSNRLKACLRCPTHAPWNKPKDIGCRAHCCPDAWRECKSTEHLIQTSSSKFPAFRVDLV